MEEREPLDAQMHALAMSREERSADLSAARAELAEAEGEVDGEIAIEQGLRDAAARAARAAAVGAVAGEFAIAQGLRDTAAAVIDPPMVTLYERCRTHAPSRIGAARLIGHTCQGCHLTIPATEVDGLRKSPPGTVAHCDNCGAILVP